VITEIMAVETFKSISILCSHQVFESFTNLKGKGWFICERVSEHLCALKVIVIEKS
jgi:hypothetical protein